MSHGPKPILPSHVSDYINKTAKIQSFQTFLQKHIDSFEAPSEMKFLSHESLGPLDTTLPSRDYCYNVFPVDSWVVFWKMTHGLANFLSQKSARTESYASWLTKVFTKS